LQWKAFSKNNVVFLIFKMRPTDPETSGLLKNCRKTDYFRKTWNGKLDWLLTKKNQIFFQDFLRTNKLSIVSNLKKNVYLINLNHNGKYGK